MATKVLGIEIGERLIKVCETNMGPGVRKVHGCTMFPTPPNAVIDGEIRDPNAVAAALKDNLLRAGMKNNKVVFTVSSGRIAIREVTIPPVRDNKIKAIVEANAADYFPVDMSKYHITYTLHERKTTGDDAGCRLLVMAAPISVLEGYFSLANLMGFSVQAVDYSGNSDFRLLEMQHTDGVTMFVDINGTYSVTTVLRKSKLLMQRTFPSGVDDYVLAYMGTTEKEEEDYLSTLSELSAGRLISDYRNGADSAGLSEYLSRLVGNITRLADYFNSSNWETPIESLVLTGVGAGIAGLKEIVAESTGVDVSVMQKLDKVSAPNNIVSELPQYISCLGCSVSPVDFIPERFSKAKMKEAKKKKESLSLGITVLAVCILGAAGLSVSAYLNYNSALAEKQETEKKINNVAYTETVYNNYISYNKYKDDVLLLDKAIQNPNDSLKQFIEELEKKMPSDISLLSADCAKDGIGMNITVGSNSSAANVIQQLRMFKSIKNITVGTLTDLTDPSGAKVVTFSVQCKYNYTPAVLPTPSPSPKPSPSGQQAAQTSPQPSQNAASASPAAAGQAK